MVQFQRKPHVDIGTLGHRDHGKTTLTNAIIRVQAHQRLAKLPTPDPVEQIAPVCPHYGTPISIHYYEYETETRHYSHADCPTHPDYVRNLITGVASMDGAILVVSAVEGPTRETRLQVRLARQVGITDLVVFINQCDRVHDPEWVELVELEVRGLLNEYAFPGDTLPVIRGSARQALKDHPQAVQSIHDLLQAVDTAIPAPPEARDQPFRMALEDAFTISGRGTVVTGRVERGRIAAGDTVEIVGLRPTQSAVVGAIEMFRKTLSEVQAGDNADLFLRGIRKTDVERGQLLAQPGSIRAHSRFQAEIYLNAPEPDGWPPPLNPEHSIVFYCHCADTPGVVRLPEWLETVTPGNAAPATVELSRPVALEPGFRFALRENGRNIGTGVVTGLFAAAPDPPPGG